MMRLLYGIMVRHHEVWAIRDIVRHGARHLRYRLLCYVKRDRLFIQYWRMAEFEHVRYATVKCRVSPYLLANPPGQARAIKTSTTQPARRSCVYRCVAVQWVSMEYGYQTSLCRIHSFRLYIFPRYTFTPSSRHESVVSRD